MHTIRLYGAMGQKFGRSHRFELSIGSPAEAVRALMQMIPGFRHYLINAKDRGIAFTIFAARRNIVESELRLPVAEDREIRIAPVPQGRKGGIFQIILGAVLVVVGVIGESPWGQAFGGAVWGPYAISAGVSMIAGGVIQLLTPLPRTSGSKDKQGNVGSTTFNGPINTVAQGNPVPVFYGGPMTVGSMVASAGIQVQESDYTATPTDGTESFMGGGYINARFGVNVRVN